MLKTKKTPRKISNKTKELSENLKKQYKLLLAFRKSLQDDIIKLKKDSNNNDLQVAQNNIKKIANVLTNDLEKLRPKFENNKSLEELLENLKVSQTLNQLTFSDENIEYLPISENEENILYKKLYKANCTVRKRIKFQFEVIINEYPKNVEIIHSINIKLENPREESEISAGLSILKRAKNLHLLFSSIPEFAILWKQREDILMSLPEKYFQVEDKDTKKVVNCLSNKRPYFTMEWSIIWHVRLYKFMHNFEITIISDDDELVEQIQPIFNDLCENIETVTDARNRIVQWRNGIIKFIKQFDAL